MAATSQADAAGGLALAYAALDAEQRRALVPAIVSDALAEGVCPSLLLVNLLGVEQDAEIAQAIADAITSLKSSALHPAPPTRALLGGDARRGAALLVRPLHGHFVEALAVAWEDGRGVTHARAESLVAAERALECARLLPTDLPLEPAPVAFAIDTLTAALWSHRRTHHDLPEAVVHFADLFSSGR